VVIRYEDSLETPNVFTMSVVADVGADEANVLYKGEKVKH